ncbi:ABC transporter substrate-binding protein [Haloarculaceae archaeon H-GB11]|nr:ABC transporter substrate-binding protein [Haloarculaceae archaeon H-GB11]
MFWWGHDERRWRFQRRLRWGLRWRDDRVEQWGDGGQSVFKVGMADSLSGSLSTFGQRNQRGKKIALEAVNEVGVKGGELEILTEDTQSTSQGGVSAAQKLVNQDQVPLLIGAVGSGVSIAIHKSVTQNTDVVQISQNSTSPQLTQYPDLLRMSPTGRTQSTALADLISGDGHDSVAISWINNDYGQGIAEAFVEAYDGEVAYNNPHDQGKASYSNVITSMADSGADAWLFVTYQPEFSTMSQEAFDKGYTEEAQWYGGDSVKGPKVLNNAPEGSLDGMKVVAPSAALNQDNYKEFASTFEERHGSAPTAWSAYAYDAVITTALAVQAADEFTGAALKEVVRDVTRPEGEKVTSYADAHEILANGGSPSDVNYEGVSGPIDLDENGDPKGFLQVFTVSDHAYESTGFVSS